ncbi:hypothetical protein CEXT_326551 [Caerostris extrusa]|uniref:Uncharacterized protein n=1 Tax=Caerostris extrusa TaxID=172846 RepID=A0AAV4PSL2_CAEEX|nr:hypothetical protein CEXT_326551 [Caerostris extrusa]
MGKSRAKLLKRLAGTIWGSTPVYSLPFSDDSRNDYEVKYIDLATIHKNLLDDPWFHVYTEGTAEKPKEMLELVFIPDFTLSYNIEGIYTTLMVKIQPFLCPYTK